MRNDKRLTMNGERAVLRGWDITTKALCNPCNLWCKKSTAQLMICILLSLCSCDRRELTYESREGILFRVTPDWSALPSGEEKPRYVKAVFFPVDGGEAVERNIAPDGEEIRVPPGEYRVIVYNWRTNAEAQTIQFRGDTYDTFEAYIAPRSTTVRTREERELHLIPQPDAQLYGWNTGEETLTISATAPAVRTRASAGNALTTAMECMVNNYVMEINVKNARYVSGISALLIDAYGSVPMGGGSYSGGRYAVQADVRSAYTDDEVTAYHCHVATLGLFDDTDKRLMLNLVSGDDAIKQVDVNVTTPIDKADSGEIPPGEPLVVIPKDNPLVIVVPENPGGGFAPPSLDDWKENEAEIPLN